MPFLIPLRKLLLTAGSTLLTLGILEVGTRTLSPQSPLQQTDSMLNRGRFTTPGIHHNIQSEFQATVHVNEHGFVDSTWNTEQTDILLIGDSFVQGAQVSMEEGLGRTLAADLEIDVKSIGIPGAGTTTELLLLREWIDKLNPHMVVVGFLPSNDVLNNHPNLEIKTDKPFINLEAFRSNRNLQINFSEPTRKSNSTLYKSHFVRWILRSLHTTNIINQKKTLGDGIPIDWHVYNPRKAPVWIEAWDITAELYAEIARLCEQHNTKFTVVIFPSIEEVSPKYQAEIVETYPEMDTWKLKDGLEMQSLKILSKSGIPDTNIVNLYPVFREYPKPDELYFPRDHHWTPAGHALASEVIQTWLQQE